MTSIAGELVTEAFGYDGGRLVTAYLPPAPPEGVVFTGDGQLVSQWGEALEAAGGPPALIVGAHRLEDEMERLHEYSPGFDPDRFAAHEEFLTGDVRRWAGSRFGVAWPAERTAVFGVSAGGELALALGVRHPDVYGAILCASPGAGYRPPAPLPSRLPRAYLVAGRQEPFFLENAVRWADALRAAGTNVVLAERPGSHGGAFWRQEFPLMVAWSFEQSALPERRAAVPAVTDGWETVVPIPCVLTASFGYRFECFACCEYCDRGEGWTCPHAASPRSTRGTLTSRSQIAPPGASTNTWKSTQTRSSSRP